MNLTPQQINQIAQAAHAACANSHKCDCPHKHWAERSEESKDNMRWFVRITGGVINAYSPTAKEFFPEWIHDNFLSEWKAKGYIYGEKKTDKTHPLLIPYDQLSEDTKLNYKLMVSITKTMMEHYTSSSTP